MGKRPPAVNGSASPSHANRNRSAFGYAPATVASRINSTQFAGRGAPTPETLTDDGSPRMVTLFRADKEVKAIGAADAEDASRQACILILQVEGGLQIEDMIQITRI